MKYLIIVFTLFFLQPLIAGEVKTIRSDKIKIIVNSLKPNVIPIKEPHDNIKTIPRFSAGIIFDIDNVQSMIVNDLNAKNNKCGKRMEHELFFLSFAKPDSNQRKINVRMKMPCISEYRAVLELLVRTTDKKTYSNIITLKYVYRDTKSGEHTFAIEYE